MDKTVLIIDDSATSRELLALAAAELPYFKKVVTASGAREGLKLFKKEHPDFVICDIQMPVMDGFEVCREIKKLSAGDEIPVLLVTNKVELDAEYPHYVGCGADDYLTKPFHAKELGARVHNALKFKAMRDELKIHRIELSRAHDTSQSSFTPAQDPDKVTRQLTSRVHKLMKMLSAQLAIGKSVEISELMEVIIAKSKDVMDCEAASLMLFDEDEKELYFLVAEGEKGKLVKKHRLKLGQGIAGWVAQHDEPVIINDVAADPRFYAGVDQDTKFETRNMICVPLKSKGKVTGVIQVLNKNGGREFGDHELELFIEFSHQIAVALENVSLMQQLRVTNDELLNRMEELSTLLEVQMALSSTMDLQDLLELIIAKIKEVMRAEAASLMLLDEAAGELVFQVAQGEAGAAVKEIRIPVGQGIAGWVAQTGEPVLVADAQHDPRLYKKADEKSKFVTRNMICAPMMYKDRIIGVTQAINKIGKKTFRESELGLFRGFSNQAAIAIENVHLFNQKLSEEKARIEMRGILNTYVAPQVAETLLKFPEKLNLGGSRQTVTVLFTDLVGFTSISEVMEPEDVVAHLNDYLSDMVEIIFDHKGTVDKFMGDAIMALFGVPIQHGDDAKLAIRTAIEMQKALATKREQWREEGKMPMFMGCGIHTGPAVVGNIGSDKRKDYTVIGDTVNVAARLEKLTREFKSGIVISEETSTLLDGEFKLRELDKISVKGRSKPLKIFGVEIPGLPNGGMKPA